MAYQSIEAFSEYLLIASEFPHVTHYTRHPNGQWTPEEITDIKSVLQLELQSCRLPLAEIYANVRLTPEHT